MRQINVAASHENLIENFFNARTITRNRINITAVNNLALALSANAISKKRLEANDTTQSIEAMSRYIVNTLQFYKMFHKKDSKSIYEQLQSKTDYDFKTNERLRKLSIKATAYRIRNHCKDHMRTLNDFDSVLTDIDVDKMTVTFNVKFVNAIQTNADIRKHVAQLTRELKSLSEKYTI